MKFALSCLATAVGVFGSAAFTSASAHKYVPSHRMLGLISDSGDGDGDSSETFTDGDAYMTTTNDSVEFGSSTAGGGSFTLSEGVEVDVTDDSVMIVVTGEDGTESSLALYDDSAVVEWGIEGVADLTIMDPVYNYTNDIAAYLGVSDESDDDDEGYIVIIGSTDDCDVFVLAFNADALITASPEDGGCGFVTMLTEDFYTVAFGDVFISVFDDKVMFGSTITGSNFTFDDVMTEINDNGDTVLTGDDVSMTFTSEGSVEFASNDESDVLIMLNPEYNYTADAFVITGNTEECEDFAYAFNASGVMFGSEDCDFFVMATDDFVAVGNGDAYIAFGEDFVTFGSSVTGSNFTIDADVTETDDAVTIGWDGGTTTFIDDTVVMASDDPDADDLTINNPVYNYTDDAFIITGDIEGCNDFFIAFNMSGVMYGSEDCGFLGGVDAETGDGFYATDDFIAVGNEDAYIAFGEDFVTFGSSVTGSNFTYDTDVSETDDDGVMITTDLGTTTFTADNTIVMASDDPDADVFTINNPVYNYTDDAFIISGDIEGCDDFFIAFNNSGVMYGSEDCGFLGGVDAETGDGFLATDDFIAVGNEDAYIAFGEDFVTFGSSVTGSNFTVDVDVSETDDDGVMIATEWGTTTFTADNTVVMASDDPDADTLTINNPVYNYTNTEDAFIISGDIEGCDDFVLAFNNDGALSFSNDCGFFTIANEDIFIYGSDDMVFSANEDGNTTTLLDFGENGDDDGSCKTISELLCDSPAADSYTTMCDVWTNSDSVNSNEGVSMTVFVPTDDAFDVLYGLLDEADVQLDSKAIEKILMFHATPGMVMSTDLQCTGKLEMFDSGSSRTQCGRVDKVDYLIQKGSGNRKNDIEPVIIASDIMACDKSVIHIISQVMLPNFIEDLA